VNSIYNFLLGGLALFFTGMSNLCEFKFKDNMEASTMEQIVFDKSLSEFYQWFVGFSDAEGSF
jgi:hypothetical protein